MAKTKKYTKTTSSRDYLQRQKRTLKQKLDEDSAKIKASYLTKIKVAYQLGGLLGKELLASSYPKASIYKHLKKLISSIEAKGNRRKNLKG